MEKLPSVSVFGRDLDVQDGNSCPQMRRLIVKKLQHERVPFECLLHDAPLDAGSAAVNKPHLAHSRRVCFIHILFDDGGDVARREGMEIEGAFDGNAERLTLIGAGGVLILHVRA